MTDLWAPNLPIGQWGSQRIDVSEVDEIHVESEGYVLVESTEGNDET